MNNTIPENIKKAKNMPKELSEKTINKAEEIRRIRRIS